ncbi:Nif3-like dinuclear metal center hexameric protein [Candidatus Amoebophilus asiaticus]|nr:Nif3-like dinuclear metal center hexameric protein [Candidatus Amoebophilus asiaticus]
MIKLKEITDHIENIAPLELQEDYDNAGLIVGTPEQEIKKVLLCIDCTEEIIQEAIDKNCELVISHHPIVFQGIKKLNGSSYVERVIIEAIKNDIAIYAVHTNLDNILIHGVNEKICQKLEIKNYKILAPKNEKDVGSGMIGELEQAQTEEAFLNHIKSTMQTPCIRHTPFRNKSIKKVAVCGGAGSFLLKQAISQGADIFISADFKYHQFFDAEDNILIADIGHYESEQYTKEIFYEILTKKFSNFALVLSEVNTNPINYF